VKASTLLVLASLTLNAVLLGVLAFGAFGGAAPPKPTAPPATRLAPEPSIEAGSRTDAWSELHSTELSLQRDRLQAEGFPPSAVRAILVAQIRERFAARRKAAEAASTDAPFWKNVSLDPQAQAAFRAIAREEQKAIRELLGPDPENGPAARLRQQFPEFPAEKIDQLVAIRERYDEQRQEIFGYSRGQLTPSEREKIAALEKAMHGEFATVLTPEELEHHDLRTSNTANSLRHRLSTFEPTESEFRALYRLQSAFDEQYRFTGTSTPEQSRLRSEAQRELGLRIAAALGPMRYEEYQRSTDYNFQQANLLVARLGLPPATANTLHAVQKEFEERRNTAYRNSTPSAREELPQQMTALHQEATARISAVLGGNTTAIDAYKQHGGSWLLSMAPRPTPAPKK
jgi:hypothetical protein